MTSEPFNFWNEKKAYDLGGFVSCLTEMSDEEFSSYVNSSKNDFANWIEYSLQNIELAEAIRPLLEKDLIKATVSNFISSEQSKLMIGTAKDVHNDSLIKEVMQKNEDFFRDANSAKKDAQENSEKGSKLTLIDMPLFKKNKSENKLENNPEIKPGTKSGSSLGQDFLAGIIFGLIMGALLTLIVIQLLYA